MLTRRKVMDVSVAWAELAGRDHDYVLAYDCPQHQNNGVEGATGGAAQDAPYAARPARVLVGRVGGGVQLVSCALDANAEELVAAAVNEGAVVACLVRPTAFYRQLQALVTDPATPPTPSERVLFFAGQQRLGECPVTLTGTKQPALHCLRLQGGLHMAVCAVGPNVLWGAVCGTAQSDCRVTWADGVDIICTSLGRVGGAEVTVALSDHTVALCGVCAMPSPAAPSHDAGDWVELGTEGQPAVTERVASPQHILVQLATATLPDVGAGVVAMAWSGRRTLWVVHDGGIVVALRDTARAAAPQLQHVQTVTLPSWAEAMSSRWLCADATQTVLHYATQSAATGEVVYGAVRLAVGKGDVVHVTQGCMPMAETVYGLRHVAGRYELLTRGESALYVTRLPCDTPCNVTAAATALHVEIAAAAESQLLAYCRSCEAAIAAVCALDEVRSGAASRAEARLVELEDAAHALLRRELAHGARGVWTGAPWHNADATEDEGSYPRRLLRQIARRRRELTVYALLSSVDALDGVERPLAESLQLSEARATRQRAEDALDELLTQSFPALAPQRSSLDSTAVRLCVDSLLTALAVPSEATSLSDLIAAWPGPTTAMVLLVLYYSYADHALRLDPDTRRQRDALRAAFVLDCDEPLSLHVWAFAARAVDGGHNPTACASRDDVEAEEEEETGNACETSSLGVAVHQLPSPPLPTLLPALLTGLICAGGFDAALHATNATLPWLCRDDLDTTAPFWARLLYLALQARDTDTVQTLFGRTHDVGGMHELATRALAYVALERGDVTPLRGLVQAGSREAAVVESVLRATSDVARRERVLLQFYILTHRFDAALRLCDAMSTTGGSAVEQHLQSVAACLRSLESHNGGTMTVERTCNEGWTCPHPCALADTPLERSDAEIAATVSAVLDRLQTCGDAAQGSRAAGAATDAVLRPSNLSHALFFGADAAETPLPSST